MDLVSASTRLNVVWEIDDTMEKVGGKATCFKVSIFRLLAAVQSVVTSTKVTSSLIKTPIFAIVFCSDIRIKLFF